jgi:hypothetical protein
MYAAPVMRALDAGPFPARAAQAKDETNLNAVGTAGEYNRDDCGPPLGRSCDLPLRKPIIAMTGCCERTESGHAAAPPSSVRNSRRADTSNRTPSLSARADVRGWVQNAPFSRSSSLLVRWPVLPLPSPQQPLQGSPRCWRLVPETTVRRYVRDRMHPSYR